MKIEAGQLVEHQIDLALGQGKVRYVNAIAGVEQVGVKWTNLRDPREHTASELKLILPIPDRLATAGSSSRVPFQLKVFGRWFEARNFLTGELSNQPFQMLPHQIIVTNRVVNSPPDKNGSRAWLIADDVGLGKTIEAGMIIEVIRKRTLGPFRCLVLTPAGLAVQWQEELRRRFGRSYRLFDSKYPTDLSDVDQLIASVDTLKLKKFKDTIQRVSAWDLVVVDEAHHLATTPNVQSYQLASSLRSLGKARNLLFLTATPHSGNNEHFFNMLRILREDLFPRGAKEYPNVPLKQVMIRNRKSDVTDASGKKIFLGIAKTEIIQFVPTAAETEFVQELQDYLRSGYKAAERLDGQTASALGFLMSTFAKLASSSRAAIESALENRLRALEGEFEDREHIDASDERFPGESAEKQIEKAAIVAKSTSRAKHKKESLIEGEAAFVKKLLLKSRELSPGDTKLTTFVERVGSLAPNHKLLIFTEYRATQSVLAESLRAAFGAESVVTINGSMKMEERHKQVDTFNEHIPNPRFMISTEAGGEGLNMQKSCHTIVNYDLPWNPMALQQRIGRVYRYGQKIRVVVWNLKVNSDSPAFADQRVYEYLERKIGEVTAKLAEVQDGHPEDIRGEVLGQIATTFSLDELYKSAVAEGEAKALSSIDSKAKDIEDFLANPEGLLGVFKGLDRFDITHYQRVAARVASEHLEFFVKQYVGRYDENGVTTSTDGLLAFIPPKHLVDVATQLAKLDKYEARDPVQAIRIARATVDKEKAQQELDCRLLRFGDPVFEAMIQHVKHGNFSEGVASLELPASALGWTSGDHGTWFIFDLRIIRQEGSSGGTRLLKNEVVSFVVPHGGEPVMRNEVVESLHAATDMIPTADQDEARRTYNASRVMAEARLRDLLEDAVREYGSDTAIVPDVLDVAAAWVLAD